MNSLFKQLLATIYEYPFRCNTMKDLTQLEVVFTKLQKLDFSPKIIKMSTRILQIKPKNIHKDMDSNKT